VSEDYKNKYETEENLTNEWDSLAEDMNWLEDQATNGDEATKEKAQKYIKANIARMNEILETLSAEDKHENAIEAQDTISEEQKAQSKSYERTFQNPDGSITHITAKTQEELNEKIREQAEANREAFSRY
jgi:uncharacterized protein with von Willebrand factor type A (vWA) domain